MKKLFLALLFLHSVAFGTILTAKSWLVADGDGNILQSENAKEVRSIASISKLMTVMVVLDAHQDLDEKTKPYSRRELIQLALIKSDNSAAKRLCELFPGGYNECIWAMNSKALTLGMKDTHFIEPTGLSVFNVSTAEELITLVKTAQNYPEIREAAKTPQVKIHTKRHWMVFHNTNPVIGHKFEFIVSKTGYIRASGGCIVMMLDTDLGRRIVVLLGSKNTHTRIPEATFIAERY
jgi:serine-type D-Ala-D-Ala endopeptidase (penicillin-binding protein 7)